MNPKASPIVKYLSDAQYSFTLNAKSDFYLLLELSKENRKSLLRIVQDSLIHRHFRGIIFAIDKNEVLLDRLFFLKDISLQLISNEKEVGIWGIPSCTMQSIFGLHLFSQLSKQMTGEYSDSYCKYIPTYQKNSSLLLSCDRCISADECDGLGAREENHSYKEYRTSHAYRKIGRDELFQTNNEALQKTYDSFREYVDHSDLTYADRYLYFVKNIDFGSPYSFSDRFVYHCDYLPYEDYIEELEFLDTHIQNRFFLSKIAQLAKESKISRMGYSKAFNKEVSRESFYLAPQNELDHFLLRYFGIDLEIPSHKRLSGVGVDFYNGEIVSFKVYYMVRSEILLQMYPYYIEKIGIDLSNLYEKSHLHIVRLDVDKKMISERVDLVYNNRDFEHYGVLFGQLPFTDAFINGLHIFGFAFEFEKNKTNKMNLYYRNRF